MIPQKTEERQLIPLDFQQRTVRTVLIDSVPWFVAKDVCDILELSNARKAVQDFPENEKGVTISYTLGGNQQMLIVNEPGLYRLIFQSRKPEAEQFKTWVFNTVLPQIRQTGFFIPADSADEHLLSAAITRYFAARQPNRQVEIKIGRYLTLLKENKPHGEFLPCLSAMGVRHRNAARYMQLYRKSVEAELLKEQAVQKPVGFIPFIARQLSLFRFNDALPLNAV